MASLTQRLGSAAISKWVRNSHSFLLQRSIHWNSFPLLLKVTPTLCAEPLKKKRKVDPAIIKMREDRKKRRIEKQIRRLEQVGQKLKPIDELEIPPKLIQEKMLRSRTLPNLSSEEEDYRAAVLKEWSRYKYQQHLHEMQMIDRLLTAQTKALNELKAESEELYLEALQPDSSLIPFKAFGPVHTPPIENYDRPDGEYLDVTRKWD